MTTTCDLSVDWNRCAYCSELRDRVQSASDLRLACSQRLDQAWEEYRAERERGVVSFGTVTHRAWQARIDNLDRQLLAADAAAGEAIDEWADCIHEHHRRYEARQQEAGDGEACADDMPCMVDVHTPCTGHCCTEQQDAAADLDEPFEKEDRLARELFGKLWYGDVPELDLPKSYSTLSPMTLAHCARAIGLYKRLLTHHAPDLTDNRPAWVARRLMDAFYDAAEAREDALADEKREQETASFPTPQERAADFSERDQCDPDDGEREKSREAARRIIADYMGVDPDDVHIICSGVFGDGDAR
ncbi:hypothetical protein [Bifidobacterium criceti]|uniref:Uncharacterized protein n=1 Tax=Bifidobacterium criceti TaxID=1960969 RepID=A0A2A2EE26_9BIFI|nr:hypothetical protein [Bifidobacterium criceti]PAU67192.1 hypothetical protein B1526_1276 [Bifidobacterium criceti]